MFKRLLILAGILGAASLVSGSALAAPQPSTHYFSRPLSRPVYWHPKQTPPTGYFSVVTAVYDPSGIHRAAAVWKPGLGCISAVPGTICSPEDNEDNQQNYGLLLAKSGNTSDNVAAFGVIKNLGHPAPLEFGYDIRNGGHCGAGSPRFNVVTNDNVLHYIGCNSPPPTSASPGLGWTRMRWGDKAGSIMPPAFPDFLPGNTITSVAIVFDEGIDTGPDFTGEVVLDNIDINAVLVGRTKCLPSGCPF